MDASYLATAKVLVTGGTGFIGRRLVEKLSSVEAEVWVISRSPTNIPKGWNNLEPRPRLIFLDLSDRFAVEQAGLDFDSFAYVIHMAATIPGVGRGMGQSDFVENIVMTLNLASQLTSSLRRMLFTSTLDVYGDPLYLPVDEGHPLTPKTLYAVSKLACEKYLVLALARRNIQLTVLRLSQVYGPGEPVVKAIPKFIHSVASGSPPTIYGTGKSVRDYVYVDDVVEAILLSLSSDQEGIFNIATGTGVAIRDVALLITQLAGNKLTPVFKTVEQAETKIVLDIARARKQLRYAPKVPLEEGLRRCLQAALDGMT